MRNLLCFTDLLRPLKSIEQDALKYSANESLTVAALSVQSRDGVELYPSSASLVREESKKSSFLLSHYVILSVHSEIRSKKGSAIADNSIDSKYDEISNTPLEGRNDVASGLIFCCESENDDVVGNISQVGSGILNYDESSAQSFLFGGFEMVTNVRSVQVFLTNMKNTASSDTKGRKQEEYLTTCNGVPNRGLPPLESLFPILEGDWYKFVLVSPGGPNPVTCVRLQFLTNNHKNSSIDSKTIAIEKVIVRSLKVTCRVKDNTHTSSMTSQSPKDVSSLTSMQCSTLDMKNGLDMSTTYNLASMMSLFEGKKDPRNSERVTRTAPNVESQLEQQEQLHQRRHAEVMASVAGLGMFLKSSEERTKSVIEITISNMESLILEKLATLSDRLDRLEQQQATLSNFSSSIFGTVRNDSSSQPCSVTAIATDTIKKEIKIKESYNATH